MTSYKRISLANEFMNARFPVGTRVRINGDYPELARWGLPAGTELVVVSNTAYYACVVRRPDDDMLYHLSQNHLEPEGVVAEFKVGDRVRIKKDGNESMRGGLPVGTEDVVVFVGTFVSGRWYGFANQNGYAHEDYLERVPAERMQGDKCHCPSDVLFSRGCQCGGT